MLTGITIKKKGYKCKGKIILIILLFESSFLIASINSFLSLHFFLSQNQVLALKHRHQLKH